MSEPQFDTFEDFWPHYVRAHSERLNRQLHFVGTTLALGAVALGLRRGRRRWLALAPVVGYGPAWIGHFLVEGNVPATFGHPLWSLRADFRMYGKMIAGTMDAEVARVMDHDGAGAERAGADGAGAGAAAGGAAQQSAANDGQPNGSSNGSNGSGHDPESLDELRNRTVN
jgi:hypothetical protein